MDPRFEKDLPDAQEQSPPTRRFAAIAAEQDATYPMLAPARRRCTWAPKRTSTTSRSSPAS